MAESVVFQVVIEALSIPDKTCHYVASAGNKPTLYNLSILSEMDGQETQKTALSSRADLKPEANVLR